MNYQKKKRNKNKTLILKSKYNKVLKKVIDIQNTNLSNNRNNNQSKII